MNLIKTSDELFTFVIDRKIAFWGAGEYCAYVLNAIIEKDMLYNIECIFVSDDFLVNNPRYMCGKTVTTIMEYEKYGKPDIIIAVSEMINIPILETLKNHGICPVAQISKELISDLRKKCKNPFADLIKYRSPGVECNDEIAHQYIDALFNFRSHAADFVYSTHEPFALKTGDPKLLVYYLPQFYSFQENDEWWGRGFTEWNNVTRAIPHFTGHYQPQLPIDVGFYDLENPKVMKRQINLAKNYGIYGFCFYYYWFSGTKLLQKPIEMFLRDKSLDFPFCLFWANHTWTKTWTDESINERSVLVEQKYLDDDPQKFISDMLLFLKDPRYITINNAALLIVYKTKEIPNLHNTVQIWRETAKKEGKIDLYLAEVKMFECNEDVLNDGFDEYVEFLPNGYEAVDITNTVDFIHPSCKNKIYSYKQMTDNYKRYTSPNVMRSVVTSWDNTPRLFTNSSIYYGSSPILYQEWLTNVIQSSRILRGERDNYIFINAWNEWAEGAHLEPDRRYGYAYLQATANAIKSARLENE